MVIRIERQGKGAQRNPIFFPTEELKAGDHRSRAELDMFMGLWRVQVTQGIGVLFGPTRWKSQPPGPMVFRIPWSHPQGQIAYSFQVFGGVVQIHMALPFVLIGL